MISAFLSPALLGLYVVAVSLTSLTSLIGFSAALVALPAVAALTAGHARSDAARFFVATALVGSVLVSLPVLIFAPSLIDLFFGEAFGAAADASRVLLVGAVAYSTSRTLEAVLQAVRRPLDAGIAEGGALIFTAAGLAALLPALELVGAALASLVAYTASAAFMVRRAARALEVTGTQLLVPNRAAFEEIRELVRQSRR